MINIVTVIESKAYCPGCKQTKRLLDSLNIEYTVKTSDSILSADEQAIVSQYKSYPVVIAGNKHWSGFKPNNIKGLSE